MPTRIGKIQEDIDQITSTLRLNFERRFPQEETVQTVETLVDQTEALEVQIAQFRQGGQTARRAGLISKSILCTHFLVKEKHLPFNPLSKFWSLEAVKECPLQGFALVPLYLFGMIGYGVALPFRVSVVVKEIFHFLVSSVYHLVRRDFESLKGRFKELIGSILRLGSGVIGVAAPPLAYKIDEKIQGEEAIDQSFSISGMWARV